MPPVDEEDLTRKQRREKAREDRKAAEAAAATDATRRKRITQLAGVAVVVIVAIVVILIATGGGSSKTKPPSKVVVGNLAKEIDQELAGIPQNGRTIGNPNAPVTIQYFGDLRVPDLQANSRQIRRAAQADRRAGQGRQGRRSNTSASRPRRANRKSSTPSRKRPTLRARSRRPGTTSSSSTTSRARRTAATSPKTTCRTWPSRSPGLNLAKWQTERSNQKYEAEIAADAQSANNNGLSGTPSFLIGKTGGALKKYEYSSLTDPKRFEEAIEQAAKG